jgi:predicted transcriptional regulator
MVLADDRILEVLQSEGGGSPKSLEDDDRILFSRQHIQNRLRKLLSAGLVEQIGRGIYRVSEDGEAYLSGDLDARDLEETD